MKWNENPRGEMPFLDHLEELRWRILWSLMALAAATVVGFLLVHYMGVMELLIDPVRPMLPDGKLAYFSPADPFFVTLKLALVVGVILAFPILVYQVWSFLAPALEDHEKRHIIPAMYLGLVLFAIGVALGYYVALPVSLLFFSGFQADYLYQNLEVGRYLAFVTKLLVAFGCIFELPVVVMVLTALGLVTPTFLRSKRKHAIVAMTVLASFITPGDVIMLTALMMVPLVFLYEFSIMLSTSIHRRRTQSELELDQESALGEPEGAVETR